MPFQNLVRTYVHNSFYVFYTTGLRSKHVTKLKISYDSHYIRRRQFISLVTCQTQTRLVV
jgi:chromosome condensin MukBEF complex kleisin-like MukF subunit